MDRAAHLALIAREILPFEAKAGPAASYARDITRAALVRCAEELGYANNERSAAVDEALTAAGTTP